MTPTPLDLASSGLFPAARGSVFLKREDTHELGAFKWRGALPTLARYGAEGADAVVTASTGNHGAATAWAAEREGVRAIVFVPEVTSETKLGLMAALGAEIRFHGADMDEAKEEARRFAADTGLPFFEDGAEPTQFDGYGEIAVELLDQLGEPPAAVVVPVGNGALLIGIGRVLAERSPSTLRVGVVAAGAPVMAESWDAGDVVEDERSETFADGLAVRVAIPAAVEELVSVAQRMLRVSERAARGGRGRVRASRDPGRGRGRGVARGPGPARSDRGPGRPHRHRPQHRRRALAARRRRQRRVSGLASASRPGGAGPQGRALPVRPGSAAAGPGRSAALPRSASAT